MGMFII
jgi:hypothetical protein